MLTHKELRAKALQRKEVQAEFDKTAAEFALLDEFLRARTEQGLTQAQVAERIGTTQSAVARMESGRGKHPLTLCGSPWLQSGNPPGAQARWTAQEGTIAHSTQQRPLSAGAAATHRGAPPTTRPLTRFTTSAGRQAHRA